MALVQNVVLRLPSVRRFLHIPQTPSEPERPFQSLGGLLRERWNSFWAEVKEKNYTEDEKVPQFFDKVKVKDQQ